MGPGAGPFHAQCTSRRSDPSAFPNRSRNHPIMHMTKQSLVLLAGLALTGLVACEGHGTAVAATSLETGYAPALVVDPRRKPIPGAKILLDNPVLYASYIDGPTPQNGTYPTTAQKQN